MLAGRSFLRLFIHFMEFYHFQTLFTCIFQNFRKLKQNQPENRINNRTGFFMSIFHFKGRGGIKKVSIYF
nr:MAG TPA: hypothetical protein [Caudoviricetes sp.]